MYQFPSDPQLTPETINSLMELQVGSAVVLLPPPPGWPVCFTWEPFYCDPRWIH